MQGINNWLRSLSNKSVQNSVIFILLSVIVFRIFSDPVRSMIDVVTIVLFAVLLTAILRPDIKELISQIKGVGFPGLQIPITEYVDIVDKVEEKYAATIQIYEKEEDEEIENSFSNKIIIDSKIEKELRNIGKYYNSITKSKKVIPTSGARMIQYLLKTDIIGKDIYQISSYYLEISQKEIEQNRHKILKIGIRIWRLLRVIFRKFVDLRILSSASNSDFTGQVNKMQISGMNFGFISPENISLFTTINLLDDFDGAFPIVSLESKNFEILEIGTNAELTKAKIIDVSPVDENINMRIVLAIDSSYSMINDNKMILAKKASKALIESLLSMKLRVNVEIALYPFSSNNLNGFINFGNERIWSNSIDELNNAIDGVVPNGDTPLRDALNLSLSVLEQFEGYKQIICLSDGDDNISAIDFKSIYTRAENSNTPIYSIGYGQDEYLQFLIDISKLTNAGGENIGSFMKISPDNLSNVFSYLSGAINHAYHIRWVPTNYRKGENQEFNVIINYETETSGKVELTFYKLNYKMI